MPRGNASRALSCRPASSSSTPTPAAWPWGSMPWRPTARPSRPTPPAPSAASSPSTARSMAQPLPQVSKQFVEVLMAPEFTPEALEVFKAKANVRLIKIAIPSPPAVATPTGSRAATPWTPSASARACCCRRLTTMSCSCPTSKVVTIKQPTLEEMEDLMFAWKVAKYVKSNAIVFCKGGMTMGVGAGQMSRLDSARIASIKARHAGLSLQKHRGGQRRLLPLPRRPGRGGGRGRHLRGPARRLHARPGGHRRGQRARRGHGLHAACATSAIDRALTTPHPGPRPAATTTPRHPGRVAGVGAGGVRVLVALGVLNLGGAWCSAGARSQGLDAPSKRTPERAAGRVTPHGRRHRIACAATAWTGATSARAFARSQPATPTAATPPPTWPARSARAVWVYGGDCDATPSPGH